MYSYVVLLLCLAVTVVRSQRYAPSQPTCFNPRTRPCRKRIIFHSPDGNSESNSRGCRCPRRRPCPDDYTSGRNVISKSLISDSYSITMNMRFCFPVRPYRVCAPGNTALVLSGSMQLPSALHRYHCRCTNDSEPMQLRRRYIGRDHMTYQAYVCAADQPECMPGATCMTFGPQSSVTYTCNCPGLSSCNLEDGAVGLTVGYCSLRLPEEF